MPCPADIRCYCPCRQQQHCCVSESQRSRTHELACAEVVHQAARPFSGDGDPPSASLVFIDPPMKSEKEFDRMVDTLEAVLPPPAEHPWPVHVLLWLPLLPESTAHVDRVRAAVGKHIVGLAKGAASAVMATGGTGASAVHGALWMEAWRADRLDSTFAVCALALLRAEWKNACTSARACTCLTTSVCTERCTELQAESGWGAQGLNGCAMVLVAPRHSLQRMADWAEHALQYIVTQDRPQFPGAGHCIDMLLA